ncbi:hypothetical protein [Nitrosopumilus adriaticus]|uniref:hypothetical protein n=1 Tax=Nitrosopumilus adriaticus TaxID=1580092 RepID=UPI00352DEB86
MDILIGLVIAMFIITAVYVGYHAMQQPVEEGEGHNVELEILNENTGIIQASHNPIIFKVVI